MPSYLGQNFLNDSKAKLYIRDLVVKFKEKYKLDHCIEIGPGKGAITKFIQPIFTDNFRAIEKDETFEGLLHEYIKHNLIMNDVLAVDFTQTFDFDLTKTLVYGSLPYYITSPIIGKLFLSSPSPSEWSEAEGAVGRGSGGGKMNFGIFIVQKEFAEKIATNAKKKSYLWRLLNYNHTVTYHKTIPAKGFSPAPKVDSAIISITPSITQEVNYTNLQIILDRISGFKRKTIGKIIKTLDKKNSRQPLSSGHPPHQEELSSGLITGFIPPDKEGELGQRPRTGGLHDSILKKRIEELSRDEMKKIIEFIIK